MIRFDSDYTEGCHPRILEALARTNAEQTPGYGLDEHCERARELIRTACAAPEADVHFLVGGTQANTTVIGAILRPWEGVLSAETGHINCHETGAIEGSGHKVLALPQTNGKITAAQIESAVTALRNDGNYEHIVQAGMVYISQPTEYGTMYSKAELETISAVCRAAELPLFLDGARLGYGLAADSELTLPDYARLCDVFYIGGTKVGCLFGEAVVITASALKKDFRNMIKRQGGMLAKGRLLGVQYETMFEDGLYLEISRNAVAQARRIRSALLETGIPLAYDSPTNQLYPILNRAQQAALGREFVLGAWDTTGGETDTFRICTSWATSDANTDALIAAIRALKSSSQGKGA